MTSPGGGSAGGGDLGSVRGKIIIDAKDAQKGADEAGQAVEKFEKKAKDSSSRGLKDAANFAKGYGVVVAGGIGLAINAAASFEQALANVAAAGGKEAASQMDAVRQKALQLGADTKFSATEAAAAMEVLIKAGLNVNDVLNGAADAAVNLAAAEGIDIPQAAEIAAVAMTSFNLKASQMPDIANKISQAASATKMDVNDFSMAMNQAGAVSKLVGLSFEDMTLAITAMGKAGIVGSDAGTSLKTMLLNLQPSTKPAREAMHELGILTKNGANQFFNARGEVKSMAEISEVLYRATAKLTPAQRQMALETMFGSDAIRAAAIIAEQGAAGMAKLTAEMNGQLSVAEKAKVKQDTLQGSLEKMKGSIETAAIQFGTVFIPVLRDMAGWLEKVADWFAKLPGPVKEVLAWAIAFSAAGVGVGVMIYGVIKAVKAFGVAMEVLGVALKAHPLILIASLIAALAIIVIANWDTISAALSTSWNWLKNLGITIWTAIKNFFIGVFTSIRDFFVNIWTSISDFFSGILTWMAEDTANNILSTLQESFIAAFTNVKDFIMMILTAIKDFVLWSLKGTGEGILGALTGIGHFFSEHFMAFLNTVEEFGRDLLRWCMDLPGNIIRALGDFGSLLLGMGKDLIMGLIRGLGNAGKWLWDAITGIVGDIKDFFLMKLGIGSPSKVTMEYGEWLTIGLAEGVVNEVNSLKAAINTAGSTIAPTLSPYVSPAAAMMGPTASGGVNPGLLGAAPAGAQGNRTSTILVEKVEVVIPSNLDPTDPVAWREAMKVIKDALRDLDKEYG